MLAFVARALTRSSAPLRGIKVALPAARTRDALMTPEILAKRIQRRADESAHRLLHLQRIPYQRGLHYRMEGEVASVCEYLIKDLADYGRCMNGSVVGACAHSLSLMQDALWNSGFIPEQYDDLVDRVWLGAHRFADEMSVADASSMMYAFYTFRDFLDVIGGEPDASSVPEGQSSHKRLVKRLVQRYEKLEETGTSQEALSVLMGMAVTGHRSDSLVQKLTATYILPLIPITNHEMLGHIAWTYGQLQLPKVMDSLVKRFVNLKSVEYSTMDFDIFANVLSGLGSVHHKDGKALASKLIQFIDRAERVDWRPRTICRLAWGVSQLDAHTPSFVGTILKETIKTGRFFTPAEVELFKEAVDEMNIEPTDKVWYSFTRFSRDSSV